MKSHQPHSLLEACIEGARGLFDIFCIGATALDDLTSENDARNLHNDLLHIDGDFRRVMSQIESGDLAEYRRP